MTQDSYIGRTVGSYRILSKLGEGGMGAVYKAVHKMMERVVAFKILPQHLIRENPLFVERFFVEARAAAKIVHPNIVQVFDAKEVDGLHYIAMELVKGLDVKVLLAEKSPLSELAALDLTIQAAKGLGAAMRRGIIHRDIKPANLMVTADGVLKVADFGLAKNLEGGAELTRTGQIMGTPAYISPEQADGQKVDFRTDIYSLGVCLFEMVVGAKPYIAETPIGLIKKHCFDPVPDPMAKNPNLNPHICGIIRKMLSKSREDRHGSYDELVEELEIIQEELEEQVDPDVEAQASVPTDAGSTLSDIYIIVEQSIHSAERQNLIPPVEQKPPVKTFHRTPTATTMRATTPSSHKKSGLEPAHMVFIGAGVAIIVAVVLTILFISGTFEDINENDEEALKSQLPVSLKAEFQIPDADEDQYGNPIVKRFGSLTDPNTGFLYEVWFKNPCIEFVLIPSGEFMMGSQESDAGHSIEDPVHRVRISKPFYLAKYEVTQAQWWAVMWSNPAHCQTAGDHAPVERVSWGECKSFCRKTGLSLPSEAQWEYACRAGKTTIFNFGKTITPDLVNHNGHYPYAYNPKRKRKYTEATVCVGSFPPNTWGLYDMHGNVWEWCEDVYDRDFYSKPQASKPDPMCASGSSHRISRGGGWDSGALQCRSAKRDWDDPGDRDSNLGFRPIKPIR